MLVQPWDAGLDEAEWQTWIADGHDFGQLSVNGPPGHPPTVGPTHFTCDGNHLLIHLARPNPVWKAIEQEPNVVFTVIGDYAFVPGPWRAAAGTPPTDGVPTSYYTAVQFICRAHIVDDPEAKADLLRSQLVHFQPDGDHAPVAVDQPPYGRMLPGIRGLRLEVTEVLAKVKYDDHKPVEHRTAVADHLTARGRDLGGVLKAPHSTRGARHAPSPHRPKAQVAPPPLSASLERGDPHRGPSSGTPRARTGHRGHRTGLSKHPLAVPTARQQLRRLDRIGPWKP